MDRQDRVIASRTNGSLKRARSIGRGKEPGLVLVEGERLIRDAMEAGLDPELLLVCESLLERVGDLGHHPALRFVAPGLLEGIGELKTAPGMAAVFHEPKALGLHEFLGSTGSDGALVVGVAGIADPGNLGALVRVAEAAGAKAVVIAEGGARPFTPKAFRGSMGSLFRVPVVEVRDLGSAVADFGDADFEQCIGATRGGEDLFTRAFKKRTVIWMTSETGAVPPELGSLVPVTIPMHGAVESLNVTVAGALLLYGAARGIQP